MGVSPGRLEKPAGQTTGPGGAILRRFFSVALMEHFVNRAQN
jgi:hypothetical protein